MKCRIVLLRKEGVLIEKHMIRYEMVFNGDLRIYETLENGYNRVVKIAELKTAIMGAVVKLFDPDIVWMNEDRFTLKGFEQVKTERGTVDYAQSWLVTLGWDAPG